MERTARYRYFLAVFTLITVIVIACILRPNLPVPALAEPSVVPKSYGEGEARESAESQGTSESASDLFDASKNCDSRGGQKPLSGVAATNVGSSDVAVTRDAHAQNLSVSYGTLVMPTPLTQPENYYQAQGKVLGWRKHYGFWIP